VTRSPQTWFPDILRIVNYIKYICCLSMPAAVVWQCFCLSGYTIAVSLINSEIRGSVVNMFLPTRSICTIRKFRLIAVKNHGMLFCEEFKKKNLE
jgi:thioredoxin-related protein